jgi:bacillithiol biosynthesis cysteine-adding enzyme BshC
MKLNKIEFEDTKRFSSIFLDYLQSKKELQNDYLYPPTIESFEQAIANRNFDDGKRIPLVKSLKDQYNNVSTPASVSGNIELLREKNTYTITTGHQLNIFTGPLFFIYKIVATINMAKILKEKYPSYNFVPVYWMATEDHDFEEINNFRLFGKKLVWESTQKGPVGRFETKSMQGLLDEISEVPDFCRDGYLNSATLSDATRFIVNKLFGDKGLVILDANQIEFKAQFKSVIKDDLFNSKAHKLVQNATLKLENQGYKSQIFPRPINFFYMEDGLRERIEEFDGRYEVLNTSLSFSKEEIEILVDEQPDKFSPNVVLRPVYQEVILPNLAYIGGPAEVSYWLQLKDVFDHYSTPFPVLFPRLFVMIISKAIAKKMDKLQLGEKDIFEKFSDLKEKILYKDSEPVHDISGQLGELEMLFESIKAKAELLDKSLEGFVMSEFKKAEKGVENIQKRMKKAEEQKQEVSIKQLEGILEK